MSVAARDVRLSGLPSFACPTKVLEMLVIRKQNIWAITLSCSLGKF